MTELPIVSIPESVSSAAISRFEELDWPTPQAEEWRRTDVTRFPFMDFISYSELPDIDSDGAGTVNPIPRRIVPRNSDFGGRFRFGGGSLHDFGLAESLSSAGVEVSILGENANSFATEVEERLLDTVGKAENRIETWRFSGHTHGVMIRVPRGVHVAEPILVDLFEFGELAMSNPLVIIAIEEGATATVVRTLESSNNTLLCNPSDIVTVGNNAKLEMVVCDDLGAGTSLFEYASVSLGRDASISYTSCHVGGKLTKSRVSVSLDEPGSEAQINGVYFATDEQHMDIKTVHEHIAPNTQSRSHFKGAVRDSGRTIFQGLIDVGTEAEKTDAYLTNNNLILNDGARADSIPSLKIRTNDVKCSHGSTTGRIDDEQVFYLMNRGFSREDASRAILEGFFEDALKALNTDIRELMMRQITARLEIGSDQGVLSEPNRIGASVGESES
jgi:Fe-S cluster assembly protein SufD